MSAASRLLVDGLREALADPTTRAEVVELLREALPASGPPSGPDAWLNTREAAAYLGVSANALHKATAARALPFEQQVPGGRCYFRRDDLDAWRRGR